VSSAPGPAPVAAVALLPWSEQPTLNALREALQLTADCWNLLAAPDGSSRKEICLLLAVNYVGGWRQLR
jgi:hypothetical protein